MSDDSLLACEAALRQAQLAGDVVELERLLDDELVFTGPDGALYSKADDLDAYLVCAPRRMADRRRARERGGSTGLLTPR